jgi:chemotaxis protein methyltransferase CheR
VSAAAGPKGTPTVPQTRTPARAGGPSAPTIPVGYRLDAREFAHLRHLIQETTGIHLKDAKLQMVQSRLTKRLRVLGLEDFGAYVSYLAEHPEEITDMINRITTNKTHFFRESKHFRFLAEHVLPAAADLGGEIRGWCAASSTGEEPYTIAMVVARFLRSRRDARARLLASDLDTQVLAHARRGAYPRSALADIPRSLANEFTRPEPGDEAASFGFVPEVKDLVRFRAVNLMDARYPIREPLHFIFCRNVFIYFTRDDRDRVVDRFIDLLHPGGHLFVGHSEVLDPERFAGRLRFVGNTTYQRAAP